MRAAVMCNPTAAPPGAGASSIDAPELHSSARVRRSATVAVVLSTGALILLISLCI